MPALGKAEFGACTFCAASHPNDKCGANGLPLTPNSIRILGNFQKLKALEHPHICTYLDMIRSKHERLIVVAEHYRDNLLLAQSCDRLKSKELVQLAYEVLQGLTFLNQHNIVHRNLCPENILFDPDMKVKLSKFGMYHMTECGTAVSFPIGYPKYLAPEVLIQSFQSIPDAPVQPSGPKVDVWSLGMILCEVMMERPMWAESSLYDIVGNVLRFVTTDCHPLDLILKDHGMEGMSKNWPTEIQELLKVCLQVSVSQRPTPSNLLEYALFKRSNCQRDTFNGAFNMFSTALRCKDMEVLPYDEDMDLDEIDHLGERSLQEVYYLWQLAGGDLEVILRKEGLIKMKPPIMTVPTFVSNDGESYGQVRERSTLLDNTTIILSQDQLRQRLANIDELTYYPLLEEETSNQSPGLPTSPSSVDLSESTSLPLVIRETNIEHQFHRVILYERLLRGYPYKKAHIWQEARLDIPPLVRANVWAALLEVEGDIQGRYESLDKETPTPTDRQIEVDIPRCHQYNELLSSPEGHAKFKRILKAWVVSHPEYVYWQGLDSLCAPFLYLNFNNEALAFSCLDAFIPKYLNKFFLKDNAPVIQEYLAVFSHLIAFQDPELSNHLDGIGFIPDLYAIPWFLTMYAHVFPLHKIFHLWDTLLLGNSSFPLCIGVAILQQLRDQLLSFGFNECILLFSDMPGIDIERCVKDSIKIFCSTPKSATFRQYARAPQHVRDRKMDRPSISYYSKDYNEMPKSELSRQALTIEELKAEKSPRISAEDLIELSELGGQSPTRSPTKKTMSSKPRIMIIDVRSAEEYKKGIIPGSVNIPFSSAFSPEGDLVPCPEVQLLNSTKFQLKVVVGGRGKSDINFADSLMRLGYAKVCVLHRGIDVMRNTGLLIVPPADFGL